MGANLVTYVLMGGLMNEGQVSFTFDYEQFNEILNQQNWSKLQHEFEKRGIVLSKSFLIWQENSSYTWLLADFETKKAYDIKGNIQTEKPDIVEILESSSPKKLLIEPTDPELIFSRLEQRPKGTGEGFINFSTKLSISLDTIDLEKLKRSDLSGAGFSFESVHSSLLIVHKMFYEILTSSNESLVNISRSELQTVVSNLKQFYDYARQILKFEIKGENPSENYKSILTNITQFCEDMKGPLRNHIAYLNSNKVDQLANQINTTLTAAEEKVNTAISSETERLQKISEEAQQKEEKRQESFDKIYVQLQNQLAEKPISQYKEIFSDQAKKHRTMAWVWLSGTGLLTLAFGGIFAWLFLWLLKDFVPTADNVSVILSNLLTKGFLLSLVFLLLNRSIKNYTAEKHLEVINTHRQNALETFDVFVTAAEGNRETRDAVLLAATRAIFEANQTGYLSAKTSSSDTASPVQQIIKEVMPSKSSTGSD